jgi:hypothetical protein
MLFSAFISIFYTNSFVKFKDNFLENFKEYKYLGCMINSNGSMVNSSLDLLKKSQKSIIFNNSISRLVIGTSRTVGSAKKFVRIMYNIEGAILNPVSIYACNYMVHFI